jgi:sugar/nucleoside kinase (ribokinase family)
MLLASYWCFLSIAPIRLLAAPYRDRASYDRFSSPVRIAAMSSTHACLARVAAAPRTLRRGVRGDVRIATPRWIKSPTHRTRVGGRAVPAPAVAAATADAPAAGPVIVGMGSAGVDYLASVAAFPKPDAKLRTDSFEVQGGGNCGNALTTAARLGARCRIITKLSDDGAGVSILEEFQKDGVDTEWVVVEPGKSSPFTYIIVDRAGSTRTCIHTPGPEFQASEISETEIGQVLTGASLVYFDGRLTEVAIKVATQARALGIPVLVEGERLRDNLPELLQLGDYVCTSADYPTLATGAENTATAMVTLLSTLPRAKSLCTTLGSRGAVLIERVPHLWSEDSSEETTDARSEEKTRMGNQSKARDVYLAGTDAAPITTTLQELLDCLWETDGTDDGDVGKGGADEDAKDASTQKNGDSSTQKKTKTKDAAFVVPLPGPPVTSQVLYLADAGDDAIAAVGPVRVTFAPAVAMPRSQITDTTGAGDSFIGSFCVGVATGMTLPNTMRLGAYVAARKCGSLGARPGLPMRNTVPSELFEKE